MHAWSSLKNFFSRFNFWKCYWNLNCLSFKSDCLSHFVLYYPRSLYRITYWVKLFMFSIFSHYVCYLLYSLGHNALFVIYFFRMNSPVTHKKQQGKYKLQLSEIWNYHKILDNKIFGHKIGLKLLTSESFCCPIFLNIRKS